MRGIVLSLIYHKYLRNLIFKNLAVWTAHLMSSAAEIQKNQIRNRFHRDMSDIEQQQPENHATSPIIMEPYSQTKLPKNHKKKIDIRLERRKQNLHMCISWVSVPVVLLVVATLCYVIVQGMSTFKEQTIHKEANTIQAKHLVRNCPHGQCADQVEKLRQFYATVGYASSEKLLPICNGYKADDKDQGIAYKRCLKQLESDMAEYDFDRTRLLALFNLNATIECEEKEYNVINLISTCPYDETMWEHTFSLLPKADTVCMRPGGIVAAVMVGDRTVNKGTPLCNNCSAACASDWRDWDCCNGTCVNLQTDVMNCGACNRSCNVDSEQCTKGICRPIQWDTCNCGKVGMRCGPAQMCYSGECLDGNTQADSAFATTFLQCHDSDATKVPSGDYSFTILEVLETDLTKKKYFIVMDGRRHLISSSHKTRSFNLFGG